MARVVGITYIRAIKSFRGGLLWAWVQRQQHGTAVSRIARVAAKAEAAAASAAAVPPLNYRVKALYSVE